MRSPFMAFFDFPGSHAGGASARLTKTTAKTTAKAV